MTDLPTPDNAIVGYVPDLDDRTSRGPDRHGTMTDEAPTVTVIIPTRDRPNDLRRALASLWEQTYPSFRVIVMDQSDDVQPSRDLITGFNDPRFVHHAHAKRGKSFALNDAISSSPDTILAFTDDDCEVPTDWIEHGVRILRQNPSIGLLFGEVRPAPHDPTVDLIPAIHFETRQTLHGPVSRHRDLLGMGANMFARRVTLVDAGLFDEDLGPGGRLKTAEESELVYRLLQGGRFSICQDPDLHVVHYGARPVDDGTATEHLQIADFAMAAGLGKHLRNREARTLVVVADQLWWRLVLVTRSLLRLRRPFNLGYITTFGRGLVAGFRVGPNWGQPSGSATS